METSRLSPSSALAMLGGGDLGNSLSSSIPPEIAQILGLENLVSDMLKHSPRNRARREVPPHNIFVSPDQIRVEIPVPGFNQEEIKVTTENAVRKVSVGNPDAEAPVASNADERCIHRGFNQNPFEILFDLPSIYSPENVNAQLVKGVLTIYVNRPSQYKLRAIEINGGNGTSETKVIE